MLEVTYTLLFYSNKYPSFFYNFLIMSFICSLIYLANIYGIFCFRYGEQDRGSLWGVILLQRQANNQGTKKVIFSDIRESILKSDMEGINA